MSALKVDRILVALKAIIDSILVAQKTTLSTLIVDGKYSVFHLLSIPESYRNDSS